MNIFTKRIIGAVTTLGLFTLVLVMGASNTFASTDGSIAGSHVGMPMHTKNMGNTQGWYNGKTVTFSYHTLNGFCEQPPKSGAPSNCEVGAEAMGVPRAGAVPILYVIEPVGFRPATSTLQCPKVGNCINHPSTLDVSRVNGPGTENVPLPAHSHIITVPDSGWHQIYVIGVKDPNAYSQIAQGKSIETVRTLQKSGAAVTADTQTNAFLFFDVLGAK